MEHTPQPEQLADAHLTSHESVEVAHELAHVDCVAATAASRRCITERNMRIAAFFDFFFRGRLSLFGVDLVVGRNRHASLPIDRN